jgi:hypothetical protein
MASHLQYLKVCCASLLVRMRFPLPFALSTVAVVAAMAAPAPVNLGEAHQVTVSREFLT